MQPHGQAPRAKQKQRNRGLGPPASLSPTAPARAKTGCRRWREGTPAQVGGGSAGPVQAPGAGCFPQARAPRKGPAPRAAQRSPRCLGLRPRCGPALRVLQVVLISYLTKGNYLQ